jgi:hypothetical protein
MSCPATATTNAASEQGIDPEQEPEDLGVRITYLVSGPASETTGPDCDFAVPFA